MEVCGNPRHQAARTAGGHWTRWLDVERCCWKVFPMGPEATSSRPAKLQAGHAGRGRRIECSLLGKDPFLQGPDQRPRLICLGGDKSQWSFSAACWSGQRKVAAWCAASSIVQRGNSCHDSLFKRPSCPLCRFGFKQLLWGEASWRGQALATPPTQHPLKGTAAFAPCAVDMCAKTATRAVVHASTKTLIKPSRARS